MLKKQEIEISISPDGIVELKVSGMGGKGCLEATKDLEEALGILQQREMTSEYYQEPLEDTLGIKLDGGKLP